MTPLLVLNPSISTSMALRVCSLSSCPPPRPAPLWRPTASISSMKMMQGAFSCPARKDPEPGRRRPPRTFPRNRTRKWRRRVRPPRLRPPLLGGFCPCPGAQQNHALGNLAPEVLVLFGSLRKSTTSISSVLASSTPATSAKVIFCEPEVMRRARLLPNASAPPHRPGPDAW